MNARKRAGGERFEKINTRTDRFQIIYLRAQLNDLRPETAEVSPSSLTNLEGRVRETQGWGKQVAFGRHHLLAVDDERPRGW